MTSKRVRIVAIDYPCPGQHTLLETKPMSREVADRLAFEAVALGLPARVVDAGTEQQQEQ